MLNNLSVYFVRSICLSGVYTWLTGTNKFQFRPVGSTSLHYSHDMYMTHEWKKIDMEAKKLNPTCSLWIPNTVDGVLFTEAECFVKI